MTTKAHDTINILLSNYGAYRNIWDDNFAKPTTVTKEQTVREILQAYDPRLLENHVWHINGIPVSLENTPEEGDTLTMGPGMKFAHFD